MKSYLIRIWHIEVVANVAGNRAAPLHARTSYTVAPESWHELPVEELHQRCEVLLGASYQQRAAERMVPIAFDLEWVSDAEMPALPPQRAARVVPNPEVAPPLNDRAVSEIDALRGAVRPGVRAKAWKGAFAAWTVSPEGDKWYLLAPGEEREHEFEARFSARPPDES